MNAAAKETSGLFNVAQGEPRLSGVALFGLSVGRAVLERASPDLEANVAALECSRFVLLEECPGNSEKLVPGPLLRRTARIGRTGSGVLRG